MITSPIGAVHLAAYTLADWAGLHFMVGAFLAGAVAPEQVVQAVVVLGDEERDALAPVAPRDAPAHRGWAS